MQSIREAGYREKKLKKIGLRDFLVLDYFGCGIIIDAGTIDILAIYGRLNRVWQAAIFVLTGRGYLGRLCASRVVLSSK